MRHFLRHYAGRTGQASPSSWNLGLAALRSFYSFLFEEEIIDLNPALRIKRRKIKGGNEPLPLSLDEFLSLMDAIEQGPERRNRSRNVAIAAVFFHCGLRVTELVSLDLAQVDFQNGRLRNVRIKGNKKLSADLNEEVTPALKQYLQDRPYFSAPDDEPALFLSGLGRRLSVRSVQEMVKGYAKRAGINRSVGPHLLRHSFATVLDDEGVPVPVIQDMLDHESISTTRRYIHVRDPGRRRASALLAQQTARRRQQRQRLAA
jgi:integrase/recombinase XerC